MIDFQPTDDQLAILETVDRFMARRLPPEEQRRRDLGHVPPYDLLPEMGELGLLGLPFPEEFGGLAQDWQTVALVQERMGLRGRMAASILNRVLGFGGMSLMEYGSEAQREAFGAAGVRAKDFPGGMGRRGRARGPAPAAGRPGR